MKLPHATALALAGWYLMYPPVGPRGQSLTAAPLADWKHEGSFDTAKECEITRWGIQQNPPDLSKNHDLVAGIAAAECLASDDPRLSSK